ncbi:aminomethyltransferase family protein [Spongiactinospora sp. 9N601]|uniref:aminomethyltransferase family protein n=1 Tax=Spongiactinospora sp. 9N601 TaxID=3375149 RepID=UPI0037B29BB9
MYAHPEGTVFGEVLDARVPLRFGTLDEDYRALRERAALFDLSSLGLIKITGEGAAEFAQRVLARDVEYLVSERCMMSLVLDEAGQIVDQVIVIGREDGVILESSSGAGPRLLAHLLAQDHPGVEIVDISDALIVIGLEGPYAWGVVGRLLDPELPALPFESVVDTEWEGMKLLFARTGFTGEYGYQFIVPVSDAPRLWAAALEHARPAGLDALELAMLEVRQPVVRHEASEGTSVVEIGANWLLDITKESFVGKEPVLAAFAEQGRRTIGFSGGTTVPEPGATVTAAGQVVGTVVHAVHSVGLGTPLGLIRIDEDLAAAGLELAVDGAEIVTLTSPYVLPKSWSVPII